MLPSYDSALGPSTPGTFVSHCEALPSCQACLLAPAHCPAKGENQGHCSSGISLNSTHPPTSLHLSTQLSAGIMHVNVPSSMRPLSLSPAKILPLLPVPHSQSPPSHLLGYFQQVSDPTSLKQNECILSPSLSAKAVSTPHPASRGNPGSEAILPSLHIGMLTQPSPLPRPCGLNGERGGRGGMGAHIPNRPALPAIHSPAQLLFWTEPPASLPWTTELALAPSPLTWHAQPLQSS